MVSSDHSTAVPIKHNPSVSANEQSLFTLGSLYIAVSVMFNFGRCEQEMKFCSSCQLVSLNWFAGNIPC